MQCLSSAFLSVEVGRRLVLQSSSLGKHQHLVVDLRCATHISVDRDAREFDDLAVFLIISPHSLCELVSRHEHWIEPVRLECLGNVSEPKRTLYLRIELV